MKVAGATPSAGRAALAGAVLAAVWSAGAAAQPVSPGELEALRARIAEQRARLDAQDRQLLEQRARLAEQERLLQELSARIRSTGAAHAAD
ncbi:MAG: hypothetical protein ACK54X_16020, partial [Burkholderiales bacterium]